MARLDRAIRIHTMLRAMTRSIPRTSRGRVMTVLHERVGNKGRWYHAPDAARRRRL